MKTLVVLAMVSGCGGQTEHHATIHTGDAAEYPGVLRDPSTLKPDFMVRQTIAIHTRHDGKPVDGEFEAVLEKHGDRLVILGFGPMNVKAFSITQRGGRIEFAQYMGPQLPFSPRNIVVDVHRVFFKRLPEPTEAGFSGVLRGELDGEHVEETWDDGQLHEIVFTRPGTTLHGAVRIEMTSGCGPTYCEPESAVLTNEWFGYTLQIANDSFERM